MQPVYSAFPVTYISFLHLQQVSFLMFTFAYAFHHFSIAFCFPCVRSISLTLQTVLHTMLFSHGRGNASAIENSGL